MGVAPRPACVCAPVEGGDWHFHEAYVPVRSQGVTETPWPESVLTVPGVAFLETSLRMKWV